MHPTRRPKRRALAVALAIMLVPVTAGAVAAAYGKPTIEFRTSMSSTQAWVDVVINRQAKQIESCTYVFDLEAPADCGWLLGSHISTRYVLVFDDRPLAITS